MYVSLSVRYVNVGHVKPFDERPLVRGEVSLIDDRCARATRHRDMSVLCRSVDSGIRSIPQDVCHWTSPRLLISKRKKLANDINNRVRVRVIVKVRYTVRKLHYI